MTTTLAHIREANPRRRRRARHRRRRNPTPLQITGIVAGTVAATVTLAYFVGRRIVRRRVDDVIQALDDQTFVELEPARSDPNSDQPPAEIAPIATLPDELLAGGVPLEPGWKTVGWYVWPPKRYLLSISDASKGMEPNKRWIRVDQLESPPPTFTEDPNTLTEHHATIEGSWRWTVVAGEATPIATELMTGTYHLSHSIIYLRYRRQDAEEAMWQLAASRGADWIQSTYQWAPGEGPV